MYKAVGAGGRELRRRGGDLPVLSRASWCTESLPLPIRGPAPRSSSSPSCSKSGERRRSQNESLTVQMVSQPGVVRGDGAAVPDGVSRTSAASRYSTGSTPTRWPGTSPTAIRRSAGSSTCGRAPPALDSPLEKNQDLKSVMLEETPWVRQAEKESQARRNVGILFDDNRLNSETATGCWRSWPRRSQRRRPGRGSPAARRTTTSRCTSPRASAACGTWA